MDWGLVVGVAAGAAGVAGLLGASVSAILVRRHQDRRYQNRPRAAMAQDVPVGFAHFNHGTGWSLNATASVFMRLSDAKAVSSETLIGAIEKPNRMAFTAFLRALIDDAVGFETTVRSDAHIVHIVGLNWVEGPCLWFQDASDATRLAAQLAQKEAKADVLSAVIDAVPIPIWWRNSESLDVVGANTAYRERFGETSPTPEGDQARDLARLAQRTGVSQNESRALVMDGYRRSYDFAESPLARTPGYLAGFASDVSALEALQSTLAEHIAVQDQVLERLTAAIAIFGPDKRVKFFNKPYADMWRLAADFLEDQPTLSSVMETLREKRQLPETSDFPAFKRDWEAMFTDLLEPSDFLLHLPDGRTLRALVSPHPLGGLIFQFDDVTDHLALESTRQTLIAVQRSTLNAVFEGVCAFGRDGRLRLFNDAFVSLFGLDAQWLATEPHVSEVAEATQSTLIPAEDVHGQRDRYIMTVLEPTHKSGRLTMLDGRVLDYAFVPLPDGQCLVLYLDVTDTTQVEEALKERNAALENADLLKSRFISSMSYELRTPLNAIMGFAELLELQAIGPLEPKQQAYVSDILNAARFLADLIGDLLDLAALQAGYLQFEKTCAQFDPIMEAAIASVLNGGGIEASRISWNGTAIPLVVEADPQRLQQAMRHLIVDALNYSDPAVPIIMESGMDDRQAAWLRVTVPLPTPDAQPWPERVLEPNDTRAATHRRATGADIDISLFRALVSAHGAEISGDDDPASILCRFPALNARDAAEQG